MEETKAKKEQKKETKSRGKIDKKTNERRMMIFRIILIVIVVLSCIIAFLMLAKSRGIFNFSKENTENVNLDDVVKQNEDGTKSNTSKKLTETKKMMGFEFSNISLTYEKDDTSEYFTRFFATVKNETGSKNEGLPITLNFVDVNGETLFSMGAYISETENGDSTDVEAIIYEDFTKCYDFNVEKLEENQEAETPVTSGD